MAGHSHSKNVQHRKDRVNAKKAKAFSKVAKMITVAAKLGGGDVDANPRLRLAVDKARMVSMPKDNIERAIKKGVGDTGVGNYEDLLYEGYGAAGVAMMLEILTDNRNRTAPEVRKIFEKRGGNLGTSGAVAWMFERKATVRVPASAELGEDEVMEIVLDAGAEDVVGDGDAFEVRCEPGDLDAVRDALQAKDVPIDGGEVSYFPTTIAEVGTVDDARRVMALVDALEEHDDVQAVYANYSFSDEIVEALESDT